MRVKKENVLKILTELEKVSPHGDLSVSELAKSTGINIHTIYRTVPKMIIENYIKESRTIDRAALYQITKIGIEYLKKESLIGR